ncbi:MAG: long-chain fatty acid--CoA ligase [Deltaproteobacteria bacterium]|nr:long-chain fatty acid--CoA ligase [Deltaproteobacteria bacterium]
MAPQVCYQDKPWLRHYQKGVPETIDYEQVCLPDMLDRTAKRFPDNTALVFQGYRISYDQLKHMVDRFAACLYGFGLRKADRVAVLLPNLIPCVVSYFSILKLGAVAVMNNPLYTDRELAYQFNDSGAKVLITLDLLANRMIDLRAKTSIEKIVYTSIGDYLPFAKKILFRLFARQKGMAASVKPADDVYRWTSVLSEQFPAFPKVEISFDDVAMCQYTGGTTGVYKGVILTHGNLSKQVQQIAAWFPDFRVGKEVMLGALPFFHVFGLSTSMIFSVVMGCSNILVPKPQPQALLEAIRRYKPTFAPMVPTMYIGILNHPDISKTDLTSIQGCFSGSAPLPVEIIREFEHKTGAVIVEGYGLTEAAPVTHINPFGEGKRKVGSIGLPIPDTDCRVVDLDSGTTDIPVGDAGELIIKGPQVMKGYWNMPQETAATLRNGWLYTGDIARMDEDGYFYIIDRKKDMIISGGYNIYPRDVEEVLYEHSKVKEACCVGIPYPRWGEAVKAFIVLKEGESATTEELITYCATQLAKYKLPTEIEFRDELPKNTIGKILRKELRSEELAKRAAKPSL